MQQKERLGRAGFTLLELMMGMVLLAVLITLGAGSLRPLWQKYQLQGQAEDLLSSMFLARSEALKRGVRATVCVSKDGVQCQSAGNWEQGWLVFEDTDGNALRSAQEPLLHSHVALSLGVVASGNSPVAHYVSYAPTGRSLYITGGFQSGSITMCRTSSTPAQGWKLVINAVGQSSLNKVTITTCP
jgi:type IV fimbrial biogenesis protein FimT